MYMKYNFSFISLLVTSMVVSTIFPSAVSSAVLESTLPSQVVLEGQERVLVLDITLPQYEGGDVVIDADGDGTVAVGAPSISSGDQLYPIAASKKLYFDGNDPIQYIWVDRDGSQKYNDLIAKRGEGFYDQQVYDVVFDPNASDGARVDPDFGAPLISIYDEQTDEFAGSIKYVNGQTSRDPDRFLHSADAVFIDSGDIEWFVDDNDERFEVGLTNEDREKVKQWAPQAYGSKAAMLVRTDDGSCPQGIAVGDKIRYQGGRYDLTVEHVLNNISGDLCIAQVMRDRGTSYPYLLNVPVVRISQYEGELDISKAREEPARDGDPLNSNTTKIVINTGSAKGIAVGDQVRFSAGGKEITFRIIEVDTYASTVDDRLGVEFVEGEDLDSLFVSAEIVLNAAILGETTAAMSGRTPYPLGFIDEDADGAWDETEPVYFDGDRDGVVTGEDQRINGVIADEQLLYSSIDEFPWITVTGTAVVSDVHGWYSETQDWSMGDDIVKDVDGDGYYNTDWLQWISVKNAGSAPDSVVDRAEVWAESNGQDGFQPGQDRIVETLVYNAANGSWDARSRGENIAALSSRLYVTVGIADDARDADTLQFYIEPGNLQTSNATYPDVRITNSQRHVISVEGDQVDDIPPGDSEILPNAPEDNEEEEVQNVDDEEEEDERVDAADVICPLLAGRAYRSLGSSSVWFIGTNPDAPNPNRCYKRAFNHSRTFFTYFENWNTVMTTSQALLDAIDQDPLGFMPAGPLYDPQFGALVKHPFDPKVYLILGDTKYWITSEEVFNALGYDWGWIEDVHPDFVEKYKVGSEINYTDRHPNYTLVKYENSPRTYRLEPHPDDPNRQVKRYIQTEEVFRELNFRFDRIVTLSDDEEYEEGEDLK